MEKIIKIIWKYLKPFKQKVYFLIFLSLLAALIASAIPMIYGRIVDMTMSGDRLASMGFALLAWLVLSLINHWLVRIVERNSDTLSVKAQIKMTIEFVSHFLHLPMSYLKEQKIGKIINGFDRAGNNMANFIEGPLFNFLPDLFTIIFILFILIPYHWLLSLVLFLVLAAYVGVTVWRVKSIVRINKKMHRVYRRAYGDHYEYLSSYQTVKAFSAETAALATLRKKFADIIDVRVENAMDWNTLAIWQRSIVTFGFVGLFGLGILMLKNNIITPGALVSFVGYISFVFGVLGRLASYFMSFNRTATEISQAVKIYNVKTESALRHKNLKEIADIEGEVIFENVSFKYPGKGQKPVLNKVSFKVNKGEVIALVGESGAGKSTLVDLISGYYLPGKGKIKIDGIDTKKIDGKALRRHIALVPQEVSLFHESIDFNIRYGKVEAKKEDVEAAAKAANAQDFILKFPKGYKSKVGERGVKLSVGQKQRIAIARALLREPRILILDEATSSLDSVTEKAVQSALERLIKNRTTFIIAHRLSTITHADRIFVLQKGKIVETGKHEELLRINNGVYRKLYEAQKF